MSKVLNPKDHELIALAREYANGKVTHDQATAALECNSASTYMKLSVALMTGVRHGLIRITRKR